MRWKLPKITCFCGKLPGVALSGLRSYLPESAGQHREQPGQCSRPTEYHRRAAEPYLGHPAHP